MIGAAKRSWQETATRADALASGIELGRAAWQVVVCPIREAQGNVSHEQGPERKLDDKNQLYHQGERMSQQPMHTLCVKQLMRATAHLSLSLITPLIVFAVVGVISAAPAYAQLQDIDSFVSCVNNIGPNATVVDAVACVPAGCYTTVTLSQESAQPACTLTDGTRLPRVIFSCAGSGGNQILRFRPSFSLCTQSAAPSPSRVINHIEVGEDSGVVRDSQKTQTMGDITLLPPLFPAGSLTDAGVQAGNANPETGCANCHDTMGTTRVVSPSSLAGNVVNLFAPVRPALAEGTIFSNEPGVYAPAVQTPLSDICTGIQNSTFLFVSHPDRYNLALNLCNALEPKTH